MIGWGNEWMIKSSQPTSSIIRISINFAPYVSYMAITCWLAQRKTHSHITKLNGGVKLLGWRQSRAAEKSDVLLWSLNPSRPFSYFILFFQLYIFGYVLLIGLIKQPHTIKVLFMTFYFPFIFTHDLFSFLK